MAKLTLNNVSNLLDYATAQTTINNNWDAIETAVEKTLSRDGTSPNQMTNTLDMNSKRIINLPQPLSANEPVRLQDLSTVTGGGTVSSIPTGGDTGYTLVKNSSADFDVAWSAVGTGDVVGPASAVNNNLAAFNGTTGKIIKDSGKAFPTGTIVGTSDSQTLTNKTLTSPAITTPTGIVKGDVGLGNVDNTSDATKNAATATLTNKTLTSPVISTIVNTGTLTLPTSTDTLVGRATTDTLTNKTLTSPVISTITNTGTLTLPTSTTTLVGRATTDTLTNKTLTSPVFGGTITGTVSTSSPVTITNATASTTTGTGALVVTGGVGIGGRLNVSGASYFGTLGTAQWNGLHRIGYNGASQPGIEFFDSNSTGGTPFGFTVNNNAIGDFAVSNTTFTIRAVGGKNMVFASNNATALTLDTSSNGVFSNALTVQSATASTSTTTGALIVTGGAGIGGAINTGGKLSILGNEFLGSMQTANIPGKFAGVAQVRWQFVGADSQDSYLQGNSLGGQWSILGGRANGTAASPTALAANDFITGWGAFGYHSGGAYSLSRSFFGMIATEAWTSTANGTAISFSTTANGTTTTTAKLRIHGSGGLSLGSTTDPGTGVFTATASIEAGTNLKTGTTTVAGLPAAGTKGRKYFVTDANATTFASVVAGGGANNVPVYDDGTNWRIG